MDIAFLIEEYLKDKTALRDTENDSINIVNNQIQDWRFTNIACPTQEELDALIPVVQAKQTKEKLIADKLAVGAAAREKCQKVLDVIAGYNESNLTATQIDSMVTTFSPILIQLQMNRPTSALSLINSVTADGTIVTQEMKDIIVGILSV
jgi:hypothetical protein